MEGIPLRRQLKRAGGGRRWRHNGDNAEEGVICVTKKKKYQFTQPD